MATSFLYLRRSRQERRRSVSTVRGLTLGLLFTMVSTGVSAQSAETEKCLPSLLGHDGAPGQRGSITDQRDQRIASDRFTGRTVAVTLIPRECDTACAMRLVDLDKVARALPRALSGRVAIVAIDTGGRSAADLRRLATTWRLDTTRWTLLRGRTETARRRLDVVPADAAEPSNVVALFDASGLLRQRYSGAPLDRERLVREIAVIDTLSRDAPASACSALSPAKLPS